jgi:K+-transporting ATPase KdpF subunit
VDERTAQSAKGVCCGVVGPVVRVADNWRFRAAGADCPVGGEAMSATNLVELILAIGLTIFLIIALLFPERF